MVWPPCSPRDSQESSPTPQFKSINSLVLSCLYSPTLTPYMATGKTIALTRQTFVGKVVSLLFNMLSRLVITFLPRSKHLMRHHEFLYKEVIPLCTPGSKVWCPCFTSLLLFETVSLYFLSTWWIWNDAGNLTQILVTNTVGILIEI